MSWLLMTQKGAKDRKLKDLKKHFEKWVELVKLVIFHCFTILEQTKMATGRSRGRIGMKSWPRLALRLACKLGGWG